VRAKGAGQVALVGEAGVDGDEGQRLGGLVGNRAWIAGIVRNARGAIPRDGTVSYFYVTDNGEGANSVLDRASGIRINDLPGQDLVFCTDRPVVLPDSEVAHGNVQVR
jgi:hypothetical protein